MNDGNKRTSLLLIFLLSSKRERKEEIFRVEYLSRTDFEDLEIKKIWIKQSGEEKNLPLMIKQFSLPDISSILSSKRVEKKKSFALNIDSNRISFQDI